ncbi:hypothetical protein AAFF_G00332850 [Aldrovandia affinis]|uniref:MMS19 nucleotide excision repair protein n=1 Tax=Aldrovandia affinis TaxID=143900 RepID=A0AAD7SMH2_9TELE|nr:hypothetical protein AAFF_G00332850 [Aldrovandia affinis]
MYSYSPGLAVSTLRSLFQDIHVQSLMLKERACVYNILLNLMESREEELKGLGADFVFGFVQAMDGERDPRNLLLAFQIARNIIHQGYEMGKFTEELFEVTSCYFPIDFTPPPNDPHGITQGDLIVTLRAVLTGTPSFAEYLLPLLIEKIDCDVQSAKLDSLQTLTVCVTVYTNDNLAEFLPGLWSSLRREVFQTGSEKVEAASLSALSSLVACVSRSVQNSDTEDALQAFLELVLTDCKHHLCEPDLKLVWPSAKLLQAAASASYRASHKIAASVFPLLLEQYNSRTECAHRRTLLEVVQGFIQPRRNSLPADDDESVLSAFRQPLCSLVFSALSTARPAARVRCRIGRRPPDQAGPRGGGAESLFGRDGVCGALARSYPAAFASRMIPKLKEEIFSEPKEQMEGHAPAQKHSQQAVRQRCVMALAVVSSKPSMVQESGPILLQVLSSAHAGSCSFSLEEVVSACHSLQRIAAQAQDTEENGRFFHDNIVPRLLGLALQAALQGEGEGARRSPLTEEAVLYALVPVISTACSRLQSQLASLMVSRVVSLFLDGDVSFLPENNFPSPLQLLKKQSEAWHRSQLVCLLMACVCSMPKSVEIPQIDRLFRELEELSCMCTHPFSYTSAAKCFAGLVNKRPGGEELDSVLERTMKRLSSELDCVSSPFRVQAFTLLLWVAKALLIRYHPLSTALTDKLFSLLTDPELGGAAADGFSVIMSDSADVLNRAGHADLRIMYRQRFFTENSAKLFQGFNSAGKDRKSGYLKALSHIVNHLPRQVQLTELPRPVLCGAGGAAVHPVLPAPSPGGPPAGPHPTCGWAGVPAPGPHHQLWHESADRLSALPARPLSAPRAHGPTFPGRVLRALAVPLGDKKRLVRKEAVLARGEWFMLGSPGK